MWVCMCMCMCYCAHASVYVCAYLCLCMCEYVCAYIYVCMYVRVCMFVPASTKNVHVCMCAFVFLSVCICVCMCACICPWLCNCVWLCVGGVASRDSRNPPLFIECQPTIDRFIWNWRLRRTACWLPRKRRGTPQKWTLSHSEKLRQGAFSLDPHREQEQGSSSPGRRAKLAAPSAPRLWGQSMPSSIGLRSMLP